MAQITALICDWCLEQQGTHVPGEPTKPLAGRVVDLCEDDKKTLSYLEFEALVDRAGRPNDNAASPARRHTGGPPQTITTGRVQCQAPDCGYNRAAGSSNVVNQHMRDEHGMDPYENHPDAVPCDYCPWKWLRLDMHVKDVHVEEYDKWKAKQDAA